MADIYDAMGATITQGLQGAATCDAALQAARRLARSKGRAMVLHDTTDDDGCTWAAVYPNGRWLALGDDWAFSRALPRSPRARSRA